MLLALRFPVILEDFPLSSSKCVNIADKNLKLEGMESIRKAEFL